MFGLSCCRSQSSIALAHSETISIIILTKIVFLQKCVYCVYHSINVPTSKLEVRTFIPLKYPEIYTLVNTSVEQYEYLTVPEILLVLSSEPHTDK